MDVHAWLEALEQSGGADDDLVVALAYLASQSVAIDPEELHGARRRALLLLVAGGDPRRELQVGGRAVRALAGDLDTPARRAQLADALAELAASAGGLVGVTAALSRLRADGELAWRFLASALLAEELADDELRAVPSDE